MYFYKNSLKKIVIIAALFIVHFLTFGMDLSSLITPKNLFKNEGALLQRLVLQEAKVCYCPELSKAEDVLREYFEAQKSLEKPDRINQKARRLAIQLINRYDEIPQLEKAVEVADLELIENIVKANPHILHCYSKYRDIPENGPHEYRDLKTNRHLPFCYYTILHTACYYKLPQSSIEKLLDLGANPNIKTGMTLHTPLHYAWTLPIVKMLIKRGARIDQPCVRGRTPLWYHIREQKKASTAGYLLKHKADPNYTDKKNKTIIEAALTKWQKNPIIVLTECVKKYSLNLFIDIYKKMLHGTFLSGYTARRDIFELLNIRYESCSRRIQPDTISLIANEGTKFNSLTNKKSALYDIARLLLLLSKHEPMADDSKTGFKNGVIFNDEDCFFYNASLKNLACFVETESVEWALQCVQQHCQDRFAKMQKERRLLSTRSQFYLLQYDEKIAFETFMFMIKNKNKSRWFGRQYYSEPFLVHGTSFDDRTLLHVAVKYKNEIAIQFFVEHGVDFAAQDAFNKTAYDYAADKKIQKCLEENIISFLLTKYPYQVSKAQKQFLNAAIIDRFYKLEDPLLVCAMDLNPAWVFEFLKHKIHVNKISTSGFSALSYAITKNNEKIALLLLERGALVNKDMILQAKEKNVCLHKALEKAYHKQKCVVCLEHPDDMINVPCKRYHATDYMCETCHNALPENSLCPICQRHLFPFPKIQSEINILI